MSEYLRIPSIKTAEIDTDYDGKFDYMTLIASIPLKPTERIYSVRSALIFDYQLSSRLRLQMESAIITDTTTPIPSSSLIIHGDMKFIQRKLLPYKSTLNRINGGINIKEPVFNSTRVLFSGDDSVVEKDGMVFKSKFLGYGLSSGVGGELESVRRKVGLWESLVGDYYNRNERTELLYSTPIWTYDQTPKTFQLSYKIRFPQDKFLYIPGLAEVLKYGWIQYFSYVVIVGVAAKALFEFAVMNFLVPSFVTVDRIPLPVTTGAYGSKYPDRGVYGFKAHSF
ncbi:hypothetical protein HK098_007572 [Nowakowskiella sp. JEL0407]|nr:hypothetical protein HK098_007572 [Nowakowskiella sp. JEL0407]